MSVVAVTGRRDGKLDRLRRHHLLAKCTGPELRRLSAHFDEVHLRPGDILLEPTPLARWLFLIDEGQVEIVDDHGRVGTLGPGDTCGLAALNLRDRQTTTARAITNVTAFAATGRDLLGVVSDIPALAAGPLGAFLPPQAPTTPRPPRPTARPATRPAALRPARLAPARVATAPPRPRRSKRAWAIVGAAVALGLLAASQYHPSVLLLSPGPVVDITDDVTIDGAPIHHPSGRYLLTSVRVSRPSLLEMGFLGFRGQVEVIPLHGEKADRAHLRHTGATQFRASQTAAAAAGARAAGIDPARLRVQFRPRAIIGPSAGLVYALLVNELLTPGDLTGGRTVAATGTIDDTGGVGLVTGIPEKAAGLHRFGGGLLLLPIDQLVGAGNFGITVIGVGSLTEAVTALRTA